MDKLALADKLNPRARRVLRHLTNDLQTGDDVEAAWTALEDDGEDDDEPTLNPELIPFGFQDALLSGQWAYEHIRWMRQKDRLGQDIFLVGMHGPLRRWLALLFCEKAGREMEYLALTADTTESDLKQRREILPGGSSVYFDQSAVSVAMGGKVLFMRPCIFHY